MTDGRLLIVCSCLIAVQALRPGTDEQRETAAVRPFIVAVDESSTLLPVARFDGHEWVNTWPDIDEMDVPVPALDAVPNEWLGRAVPRDWTLWFTTGGSRRIHVSGTERSGGCAVSPKLTIANPPPPPSNLFDESHRGLATTDDVPVEPVALLKNGTEYGRVRAEAIRQFRSQERRVLDAYAAHGGWADRLPGFVASTAPIAVEFMYRVPGPEGRPAYFMHLSRQDPKGKRRIRIAADEWLMETAAGTLTVIAASARPEEFEFVQTSGPPDSDVTSRVPLGGIHVGTSVFLIIEVPTGETTSFRLVEVRATGVDQRLSIDAGGC